MTTSSPRSEHYRRIEPTSGWRMIPWRELVEYRDLFVFLVLRDIKVIYKQTVLGFAWAIIRPVVQMVLFTFVFGNLAKVSSDGLPYPVFSYAALVPWTYFSTSMTTSTLSLVTNAAMITKIYFPRMVIPMSSVLAKLVDFAIAFVILFVLMAWYRIPVTVNILLVPALILLMVITAAGVGLWLSAMTVQYRDMRHAAPFLVQVLMYAAPVVWPASLILENYGTLAYRLYGLYPMAGVIEGFRAALLGARAIPWDLIGVSAASAMSLFCTGAFYFQRMEKFFADVA